MNTPRRPLRGLGLTASLALLAGVAAGLAGCSAASAPATLSPKDSPLIALLGPLAGMGDDGSMRDRQRAVEKQIAGCMTAQGFEYTPSDSSAAGGLDELAAQQTEEWVSTNGYGFSGVDDSAEPADPNRAYIDSLTDAEKEAYYEALYGAATSTDEGESVSTDREYDPATAGCSEKAQREAVGGKGNFWDDQKYAGLLEKASALQQKSEKVKEVVAASAEWAGCMADAGYPDFTKKSDAMTFVEQKNAELYGIDDDAVSGAPEPTAAERKAFRDLELKVALADFRCDRKVGYSDVQLKAQFALEETFIRENRAQLDELVEAYGGKK